MALLKPEATLLTLTIPETLNRNQRKDLADLVIEYIYDRTDRGLDVNNKPFKKYSQAYIKSLPGIIGRKGSKVDLQLSGDMLAAVTLLENRPGEIVIGFKDKKEREVAEGNIIGSYGGGPNPAKARNFLGIKAAKLKELIDAIE